MTERSPSLHCQHNHDEPAPPTEICTFHSLDVCAKNYFSVDVITHSCCYQIKQQLLNQAPDTLYSVRWFEHTEQKDDADWVK